MHQPLCNKCQRGTAAEGDSWCIGCASLEVAQKTLRTAWHHPGLRRICEESLLSAARLSRAFANLDQSLRLQSAPGATAKAKADNRSRSRGAEKGAEKRADRSHSGERGRGERRTEAEKPVVKEERRDREPTGHTDDSSFQEETEEESEERSDEEQDARTSGLRRPRGDDRPPEPPGPPPRRGHQQHNSGRGSAKKRRRGGVRHQRRYREEANPLRRSHRGLDPETTRLARSAEEGLSRRY